MNKNTALIFAVLSGISFGSVGVFVRIFTRAGFDNISILAARVLPAVTECRLLSAPGTNELIVL